MKTGILPRGFHAHKYHALGNDYLVIDPRELEISLTPASIVAICDRNHGVGSDGILYGPLDSLDASIWPPTLSPELSTVSSPANFSLRIFNPDGTEAEKSGNGLRIFSLYLYEAGLVENQPFHIATKGGVVESRILPQGGGARVKKVADTRKSENAGEVEAVEKADETEKAESSVDNYTHFIEVAMGAPEFLSGSPEMTFEGIRFRAVRVSIGNPHCVLLGHTPSEELARRVGPLVERHSSFPHRTNVQFLEVIDRRNIRIEIWERGAGYTLASGTSSCAAAAAARSLGLVDDVLTVHMPGGELLIDMSGDNITMTGPAVRTFDALFSEHLLRLARLRR